jgi:hypothetical protein
MIETKQRYVVTFLRLAINDELLQSLARQTGALLSECDGAWI